MRVLLGFAIVCVLLLGWVHKVRDLGHLVFLDVRDRHGLTQVVVEAEALRDRAKHLRAEFVVGGAEQAVRARPRPVRPCCPRRRAP